MTEGQSKALALLSLIGIIVGLAVIIVGALAITNHAIIGFP